MLAITTNPELAYILQSALGADFPLRVATSFDAPLAGEVVLLDLAMVPTHRVKSCLVDLVRHAAGPIVLVGRGDSAARAESLLAAGAADYVCWDCATPEYLRRLVSRVSTARDDSDIAERAEQVQRQATQLRRAVQQLTAQTEQCLADGCTARVPA